MKILHINTEKTWRGGEQQTLYLLQGLHARNITSHLICQPGSPMAHRAGEAHLKVIPVAMHAEIDPGAACRIRSRIKKSNYDIIHSHTSHAHTLAFAASAGVRVKRLVTRRVDFSIFRHSFLHLSGIKYRYLADFYVAISQKIKDVLINDGIAADRISVIHSGINPERFTRADANHLFSEFDIKPDEKVVINVAHLAGHKGQEYLVRAVSRVLAKIPKVRFFIIGKGELMAELKALATSQGINQNIVLTGFRNDVGAFYNIADLFVMSSVQEGLGTAVLDALALGKPVVATKSGGIPEIIRDGVNGRLVEPADPAALADGIVDLLSHADRAKQMGARGKKEVIEKFSLDAMVDAYIEVYERMVPGA